MLFVICHDSRFIVIRMLLKRKEVAEFIFIVIRISMFNLLNSNETACG